MAFCNHCGQPIPDNTTECANCAAYRMQAQQMQGQPMQGQPMYGQPMQQPMNQDRPAEGWEILICILFPIVGAILYYVYKGDHPTAAKTLNRASLLAFLGWFLLGFGFGFFGALLGAA